MEKKLTETIENAILNFPKDEKAMPLKNHKIKIIIIRKGADEYSINAFGLEFATKKNGEPVKYIPDNFNKIRDLLLKQDDISIEELEKDNPDFIKSDLNLEDTADLKEKIDKKRQEDNKTAQTVKKNDDRKKDAENHRKGQKQQEKQGKIKEKQQIEIKEQNERQKAKQKKREEKKQDRVELNLTRENTSDETLKQWFKRTMKVDVQRVVRVRTGSHTYTYEIYNQKGEKVESNLLTPKLGGTNPRMKIWVLNNDGHFEQREMDSIELTQNGRYGLATDRGNGAIGNVTNTYQVTRLPGGEYVALQALEQQKRNREASGIREVKDLTASKKSDYDMKNKVIAAKTAKDVEYVLEDGVIDYKEVTVIEMLKKEGFSKTEIDSIFKDIYDDIVERNMTCKQVEDIIDKVKQYKERGYEVKVIHSRLMEKETDDGNMQRTPGGDAMERRNNHH